MALWECAECTAQYSVGAPKCPQCGSTVRVNEGTQPPEEDDMAKVTVHGGPSNEAADEQTTGEVVSETEQDSSETSEEPRSSRARKTASPSKKARTSAQDTE